MTKFGLSTAIFGAAAPGAREFDLIAANGFSAIRTDYLTAYGSAIVSARLMSSPGN